MGVCIGVCLCVRMGICPDVCCVPLWTAGWAFRFPAPPLPDACLRISMDGWWRGVVRGGSRPILVFVKEKSHNKGFGESFSYPNSFHQRLIAVTIVTIVTIKMAPPLFDASLYLEVTIRSEERRVGKECSVVCRSRWSPYH